MTWHIQTGLHIIIFLHSKISEKRKGSRFYYLHLCWYLIVKVMLNELLLLQQFYMDLSSNKFGCSLWMEISLVMKCFYFLTFKYFQALQVKSMDYQIHTKSTGTRQSTISISTMHNLAFWLIIILIIIFKSIHQKSEMKF